MIPFHPLADIFPLIEGQEFADLVADISSNGLREPIVLLHGKILDGRNRYRASVAAKLLPEDFDQVMVTQLRHFKHHVPAGAPEPSQAELLDFVWSKNWHRRHLTQSQRAIILADYEGFRHGGPRKPIEQDANLHLEGLDPERPRATRSDLAEREHVSERLMASAAVVRDRAIPELKEVGRRGDLTVTAIEQIVKSLPAEEQKKLLAEVAAAPDTKKAFAGVVKDLRRVKQDEKKQARSDKVRDLGDKQRALPDEKFGVILADPEWPFEVWSEETGQDRAAANHYPTSTIEVIKSRPVASIAADECVLGLWATVPKLPAALDVMREWGFTYVSQIVWVKDRIGMGYWFRNNHEILLIGKKGLPPKPADGTQWKSAIEAPRSAHSEKPDFQYEFFETFFPGWPAIELNARRSRPGWKVWGLEAPADEAAA
jgi:N6-adenosine-specific RNA methylase IME4